MNKSQSEYPILYKYLDIDGAKKMLSNSNLQYTNATKFNDPFDSHPSLIDFSKVPDRKSTRLNSSHIEESRMPSSA